MLLYGSTGKVLGKKVCGIRRSKHFEKGKSPFPQALLHPQLADRQMADAANSAPPANAYSGGAICKYLQRQGQVEVEA